jgi:general secretion pathway protein J
MRSLARSRGMTLLEIMVSMAILAMMSLLIYGAFNSVTRGKTNEAARMERFREGRGAVLRMSRELSSAYLSDHGTKNPSTAARITSFVGTGGMSYNRVDFCAFVHRRTERDAKESDQAEVGYFVVKDPVDSDVMDLVRREQPAPDTDGRHGGHVDVLARDVEEFTLKYLDPMTGNWLETWDSLSSNGQPNRLPMEVRIVLKLRATTSAPATTYGGRVLIPVLQPLGFGN